MNGDKMEKVITELAEVLKKHNIMYFINVEDLSTQIANEFENNKVKEIDSSDIYEMIDVMIVDLLFYLYDCSKEKIEKKGIKVIE